LGGVRREGGGKGTERATRRLPVSAPPRSAHKAASLLPCDQRSAPPPPHPSPTRGEGGSGHRPRHITRANHSGRPRSQGRFRSAIADLGQNVAPPPQGRFPPPPRGGGRGWGAFRRGDRRRHPRPAHRPSSRATTLPSPNPHRPRPQGRFPPPLWRRERVGGVPAGRRRERRGAGNPPAAGLMMQRDAPSYLPRPAPRTRPLLFSLVTSGRRPPYPSLPHEGGGRFRSSPSAHHPRQPLLSPPFTRSLLGGDCRSRMKCCIAPAGALRPARPRRNRPDPPPPPAGALPSLAGEGEDWGAAAGAPRPAQCAGPCPWSCAQPAPGG
jgi:hypothetical protein